MTQNNWSYVGAVHDYKSEKILVWERSGDERRLVTWPAEYYFFVPDPAGNHLSIDDRRLTRLDFKTAGEMEEAARKFPERFESDIPPLFKCLMNHYYDVPTPNIHYAFIDIEVDYKSSIGFAGPSNPYAPINAVTIYQSWTNKYRQYVVPPVLPGGKKWPGTIDDIYATYSQLIEKGELRAGLIPEVVLCENEAELLRSLVNEIQDADIISGWNSEFFDLPYIVERLKLILPTQVPKLSFKGAAPPREKMVERFGAQEKTYMLYGRTHLDYLRLFEKFTFEGRESFALGNILQEEVGMSKLHYEGTLEQLYNGTYAPNISGKSWEEINKEEDELLRKQMQLKYIENEIQRRKQQA